MTPRTLLLRNKQSPGDVLMLTAAVRDLHRQHPGKFVTAVATSAGAIWENNPWVVRDAGCEPERSGDGRRQIRDGEKWEDVVCEYPLIHRSNTGPWHFVHAFHHFLSEKLGVRVEPMEFRGDIHLAMQEKAWMSQVQEATKVAVPYWIVVSGGKYDFTAKWWDPARMQAVVDHFAGRILFVQVGEQGHHHPPLSRVMDLRGKTTLRQFIRLMHHAQGVVCPVTFAMHLAAAVETRGKCEAYPRGMPRNRPCVVIAGGREPSQWEAYPHHQYIHTNGALRCCENGGCWKSRVVPLGDGNKKDRSLCGDVVELATGVRKPGAEWGAKMRDARFGMREGKTEVGMTKERRSERPILGQARGRPSNGGVAATITNYISPLASTRFLPRCLDMVTTEEVIRRIEMYFTGGAVEFLTKEQKETCNVIVDSRLGEQVAIVSQ